MSTKKSVRPPAARGPSAQLARQFQAHAQRFTEAMKRTDYAAASQAAEAALKVQPGNVGVLADYALSLMRQKRYEKAHEVYLRVYKAHAGRAQAGSTWLDGLTEVCGWLARPDDLRRYGRESLDQADARLGQGQAGSIPSSAPPVFEANHPERNIIAYTLFGDSPRYCEPAVKNVEVAADLFAQWRCRVYLDDSVPSAVQQRLRSAGAQVVDMTGQARDGVHPLMWRFLVADDPGVSRFLIRDADALLSEREQMAVQEWITSSFWFHHIRDYFTHTELILAGLWGGCRGALPPLKPLMQAWLARQGDVTRFADQIFLREMVWPTLRQSVLNHDELFGFHGARPFPAHPPIRWNTGSFHVGSNASFQGIRGSSSKADGERQSWTVLDEQGATVCAYSSPVLGNGWSADLPFFLVEPIAAGRWKVQLVS
ncbi:tetratricopeptide repeat protein [Variovorax sp. J22R24]|uniref:tetratricopeptide repeat protein n=1 Tax=Variovorax gracilis TaxID=3053502 RepID=UPI002578044D|nr:tetratricopeptide repeat protein [Variovorax sp. J22R24]MDM0109120.1 tetratricopeptide repeat protein [Variovorax sp. J22R24]